MLVMLFLTWQNWPSYQVGQFSDDGAYVSLADSLLQGIPYGTLLTPNEPYPTQFPFVFPFLLVPLRAFFPHSLDVLRLLPMGINFLTLAIVFWGWNYIGRGLSYRWGTVVNAILALSPLTILYSYVLMSEAIFLFFCLVMVVWIEYGIKNPTLGWGIGFGVLAVCIVFTRTVGWAFLAAWIVYLIWKWRRASLPRLSVGAVTMVLLLGAVTMLTTVQPRDLFPQFYLARVLFLPANATRTPAPQKKVDGATTQAHNEQVFLEQFARRIWFHMDATDLLPYQLQKTVLNSTERLGAPWLRQLFGLGGLILLGAGGIIWVRRTGVTALQVVVVPYLVILSVWGWSGARFVYPIQLQLVLCLLFGVWGLVRGMTSHWHFFPRRPAVANAIIAVLVGAVLIGEGWLALRVPQRMLLPDNPIERAAYLRAHIPMNAVVLSVRATMDYLYIPQRVVHLPQAIRTTGDLKNFLSRQQVQYIVSPRPGTPTAEERNLRFGNVALMNEMLTPLLEREAVQLEQVHPDMDLAIYSVNQKTLADAP